MQYAARERSGVDASDAGAVFDRRQTVDLYEARLSARHKTSGGLRLVGSLKLSHLRDQFLLDQRQSDRQDKYEDTHLLLAQTNLQTDVFLPYQNVFSLGLEGFAEEAENPRIVRSSDCSPGDLRKQCITAERLRGAVYAQNVFTALLDPYLVFVVGARFEGDNRFGSESIPRIAMRLDPTDAVAFRISVGQGYRAPTFKELYLRFDNPSVGYTVRGNEELTPEHSVSYQTSIDSTLSERLSLHVGAFRNEVDDLIDFRLVSDANALGATDQYQLTNVGKIRTQGGLSEVTLRLWTHTEFRAGYQFLKADNLTEDRALQGRARHQISGTVHWTHESTGVSLMSHLIYTGARPFYIADATGSERKVVADAYTNVSATFGYQLSAYLKTFIRGENLLDEGQTTFLAQRPRRFVLGLGAGF